MTEEPRTIGEMSAQAPTVDNHFLPARPTKSGGLRNPVSKPRSHLAVKSLAGMEKMLAGSRHYLVYKAVQQSNLLQAGKL
jgi:hypothetical protein